MKSELLHWHVTSLLFRENIPQPQETILLCANGKSIFVWEQERWKRTYYGHLLIISNNILTTFVLFCLLAYSCAYRYSSTAFLFSLVNKPGWGPVKFSSPGRYNNYHTYSCYSYGPTFGGGHDIYIANYRSGSYSSLGYSYEPPAGHSYGSSFTQSFLAGSYYFVPDEVEVFYETT